MKLLARLRRRPAETQQSVPSSGEPLLTCFDCRRAMSFGQLTLFPWWDERVNDFDMMYRCERCLPKARMQVLRQLMNNEEMLGSFVEFASKKVFSKEMVPLRYHQGTETLDYARHILDALVTHEASIIVRRLGE